MKKIICISMLLLFVNVLFAGQRVYLTASYDDPTSLGITGNASVSSYGGGYPPSYYNIALREINVSGYRFPITAANGFVRTGNMQLTASVSGGDTIAKKYLQNYTVGGKTFNLSFTISRFASNGSDFDLYAQLTWPSGAPSVIAGVSTSSGLGIIMRCDYDFPQYWNQTGMDGAGWRPLTAYSDNSGNGWDVSADYNDGLWKNSGARVLARFFDSDWRIQTGPIWNIQWVDGRGSLSPTWKHYTSNLKGFLWADGPVFSYDYCSPSIQTIATGGHPVETQLSPFVPDYGGSDQGAFMTQRDPSPSLTSSSSTEIYLSNGASIGTRSIYLRWYYCNSTYGNNRYVAFGDSVPGAMRKLLWGTGSVLAVDRYSQSTSSLQCNNYGNYDNICTMQELWALEFSRWPGMFYHQFLLNTAVYVLKDDQGYIDNPDHIGGMTFSAAVPIPGGSATMVRISRAFVFPRASIHTGWGTPMVYMSIAHELGHTFGMSHQFSNCNFNDGGPGQWNCPNGYIMSYSATPVMDYGPDAKTWFNKAPDNWVQPVCGSGPMDEARFVNGIHTYDLKVNDIINW
jgi:hypothetical protein